MMTRSRRKEPHSGGKRPREGRPGAHMGTITRGDGGSINMIEFSDYQPAINAPSILVNRIGGVFRLPGGIIKIVYALEAPGRSGIRETVERVSTLWPEHAWTEAAGMLHWALAEFKKGTFSEAMPDDGGGRRARHQ